MRKLFCILVAFTFLSGCGGPTKLTYPDLPKEKPLAIKINNVTLRVVSFGYTKDWSELEIAVANETDHEISFDASQIYLTNEQGYDLIPLSAREINDRVHRKTGKWITPLTLGAVVVGLAALIAPSSKDRAILGRSALALAGVAAVSEVAKRQTAGEDISRKEDLLMKNYNIPPHLQLGGVLYYRSTKEIKGVKAFIRTDGNEEFFNVVF
ncbi:MAG: hypothetical protein A2X59_06940 [Nitrospirae bacterium GWC2_42_7]|nr:MAG: hypothetical protein A2X59_06940 [Nitrospirae bacterium GWC2_42_7]